MQGKPKHTSSGDRQPGSAEAARQFSASYDSLSCLVQNELPSANCWTGISSTGCSFAASPVDCIKKTRSFGYTGERRTISGGEFLVDTLIAKERAKRATI